jgi:hypothetical protein
MAKFRKRPVVIDAEQFTEWRLQAFLFDDVPLPDGVRMTGATYHKANRTYSYARFDIKTLEGAMTVSPGDWIITGVKGERYPCKPDIFEATYEAVTEEGGVITFDCGCTFAGNAPPIECPSHPGTREGC